MPRGIWNHATFVVDTASLEADIVSYGDSNGSWTGHARPRRKYQVEIDDDTSMSIPGEFQSETQELEDMKNDCHSAGLWRQPTAVSSWPVLFRERRRSASKTGKAWECKRGKFLSLHEYITSCSRQTS